MHSRTTQVVIWTQTEIDKDILKAAGVTASRVTLGMPGLAEAKKIIKEYYLGK